MYGFPRSLDWRVSSGPLFLRVSRSCEIPKPAVRFFFRRMENGIPYHRSRFWILKIYADRIPQGLFQGKWMKMDQHIWTKPRIRRIEPGEILRNFPVSFFKSYSWWFRNRAFSRLRLVAYPTAYPMICYTFGLIDQRGGAAAGPPSTVSKACLAFQVRHLPVFVHLNRASLVVGSLVGHCIEGNHEWFCWGELGKRNTHTCWNVMKTVFLSLFYEFLCSGHHRFSTKGVFFSCQHGPLASLAMQCFGSHASINHP